jgi:hypothetical protein
MQYRKIQNRLVYFLFKYLPELMIIVVKVWLGRINRQYPPPDFYSFCIAFTTDYEFITSKGFPKNIAQK